MAVWGKLVNAMSQLAIMPVEIKESIECIEGHNAGMPVKVVFLPYVDGSTMLKKKAYCENNLDYIRKMLTYEPRSGSNSYGVVVTKPSQASAHFGALYFDPSGWHDMCGHATMFLGSLAVQRKLIPAPDGTTTDVIVDTPAGLVTVHVKTKPEGGVERVSLVNVPSFLHSEFDVKTEKYGEIHVSVAFGGGFYGLVDLEKLGLSYSRAILPDLSNLTREILGKLKDKEIVHPSLKKVSGIYGIRYQSRAENGELYGVLFFGNEKRVSLDRSPSGTSSSAHLAYLYYVEKSVALNQEIVFRSSIDTKFRARAIGEIDMQHGMALIPEIASLDKACFITGFSTYVLEAGDPMGLGHKPLEPF